MILLDVARLAVVLTACYLATLGLTQGRAMPAESPRDRR